MRYFNVLLIKEKTLILIGQHIWAWWSRHYKIKQIVSWESGDEICLDSATSVIQVLGLETQLPGGSYLASPDILEYFYFIF